MAAPDLTKKANNCHGHKTCRDLDVDWSRKRAEVTKCSHQEEMESQNEVEVESSSTGSSPDLNVDLSTIYRTKTEDLQVLTEKVEDYNRKWATANKDKIQKNEVTVYSNVTLTEDELSLLNLGPRYMVVTPMDPQEMMVELNMTMTKIHWSRRKKVENMSKKEEEAEEIVTEEEGSLMDKLEASARDVVSDDGKSINMGRKCPTDQINNRIGQNACPRTCRSGSNQQHQTGLLAESFHAAQEDQLQTGWDPTSIQPLNITTAGPSHCQGRLPGWSFWSWSQTRGRLLL